MKRAASNTFSTPAASSNAPKHMGGGNAQHTNYWDLPSIMEQPDIAWQIPLPTNGLSVNSQPAVDANGNVYIDYRTTSEADPSGERKRISQVASYTPTGRNALEIRGVNTGRSQSIPAFLPNGDFAHMFRDGSIRLID